jgi:hypothetical protein
MRIFTLSWCLLFVHDVLTAIQHCVIRVVDTAQSNNQCIDYKSFEFTPLGTRFMETDMLLMLQGVETCQTHTSESDGTRPKLNNVTNVFETARKSEKCQASECFNFLCGI